MQETPIQELPTAAQESRNLRPRGRDASRVTPGAQLSVESTSENLQVVANSLAATPSEPEDPSDQVPVADDSSSIVPPDRSIQLQADDSTRRGTLQLQHSGSEQNHTASDTESISDESSDRATYRRLLKKFGGNRKKSRKSKSSKESSTEDSDSDSNSPPLKKKSQKSSRKKNSRPIELQELDKIVRIHDRTIRKRKVPLETPEVVNYSYESTPTPLSRQETQIPLIATSEIVAATAIVETQKSKSVADTRIPYSVPFTKGYSADPIILNADSTRQQVQQCIANLQSELHHLYEHREVIAANFVNQFERLLQAQYPHSKSLRTRCSLWANWSRADFISALQAVYPQISHDTDKTYLDMITDLKFVYDINNPLVEQYFSDQIAKIDQHYNVRTTEQNQKAAKILFDKLDVPHKFNFKPLFLKKVLDCNIGEEVVGSAEDFNFVLLMTLKHLRTIKKEAETSVFTVTYNDKSRNVSQNWVVPGDESVKVLQNKRQNEKHDKLCNVCGGSNHDAAKCRHRSSEYANLSEKPYVGSDGHAKLVAAKGPSYTRIPYTAQAATTGKQFGQSKKGDTNLSSSSHYQPATIKKPYDKDWKSKSKLMTSLNLKSTTSDFLTVSFTPLSIQGMQRSVSGEALLDTGCLAGDFISERIVDNNNLRFLVKNSINTYTVCSGLDNQCYDIRNSIPLRVSFLNEAINNSDTFDINAIILKDTPIDLIIGRETIKKNQLFQKIPSQLDVSITEDTFSDHAKKQCGCQPNGDLQPQLSSPTVAQTSRLLASLHLESEQLLGIPLPDDDDIDHDKTDTFKPWLPTISDVDILSLIHISGDDDLQERLHALCEEFRDVFSNELPKEPARIPEFNLVVDDEKWRVRKNRDGPRTQSAVKQSALFKTVETLLKQGIIEYSQSAHYSQILMVPKPDGTFRMCVDYRALNDCTPDASWPIPNIAEMLRRIGTQKPKIFGAMDLTQGYHQAPLTYATRAYTSFITFSGVYQFTRLPFGPKRAPSYFQEIMVTIVLVGLIYMICEMCICECM